MENGFRYITFPIIDFYTIGYEIYSVQVHRAFLMASLILGATAFVLIFVALMSSGGLVDVTSVSHQCAHI